MSETTEITRQPRQQREIVREPVRDEVVIESLDHRSPEDALEETSRLLADQTKQTAAARQAQRAAETQARQAEEAARQAVNTQGAGRASVVASQISAAKAEKAAALSAYRAAREAGDIDAEVTANDMLSEANTKLQAATAEAEWLKTQTQAQPRQTQPGGPSPAAKQWLDDHPAYATDIQYRGTANEAHNQAIREGAPEGSQQYIDRIEAIMTDIYGEGHGQSGKQRREEPMRERQGRGDAAPPSRNIGQGGTAGFKTLDTGIGTVHYQKGSDGKLSRLKFTDRMSQENIEEAAQTSFRKLYEQDPQKAIVAAVEQYVEEFEEGGSTIKRGDGRRLG